ncbi:MAG: hypothetical protein EPO22_10285 [Dehalococcoidia bacterium]|nr:MAG: hypothetical protein EPO22_10285 [Dehalococcoidia bacterium]
MTSGIGASRLTLHRTLELVPAFHWRMAARMVALALVAALAAVVVLLMAAPRAPLTSDESLYISEALNIAKGIGPRYSTHELVQHRPFLFPALLAIPLRLSGDDFTSVYWMTKCVVLLNALAIGMLVRGLRGNVAALFALALVLPNAFLNSMGVSAYLDGAETWFLLVSLILLWTGFRRRTTLRWWTAAGAALGLAFLTKEAAILWLPLPVIIATTAMRPEDHLRRLAAACAGWLAGFVAVAGWWWPYVYLIDRRVYMWPGSPRSLVAAAVALATAGTAGAVTYRVVAGRNGDAARQLIRWTGIVVAIAWVAAFIVVMETASWPYPKDFAATIPNYLRDVVAGNMSPWPLAAGAVVWLAWRARRHEGERLLVIALFLWLPFATFVANRGFALRDLLPMIYIVYAGAGILLADVTHWVRQDRGAAGIIAVAAIVAAVGTVGVAGERTFYRQGQEPRSAADWDNGLVRRTAAWLDAEVAPGTPIMSSRLYFSQLYTRTSARYPIFQLPTVNVVPHPGRQPYLAPRSTLFRWEDDQLSPARADARWITVDEFPQKRYFTALSEEDLLAGLRRRRIGLLILSGEDAAFSSTRYLDYFHGNGAFQLVHEDREDAASIFIFRVDDQRLQRRSYATVVPASVLNHLYAAHRGRMTAREFLEGINPQGVVVRPSAGLSAELSAVTTVGD